LIVVQQNRLLQDELMKEKLIKKSSSSIWVFDFVRNISFDEVNCRETMFPFPKRVIEYRLFKIRKKKKRKRKERNWKLKTN
jgi:uncharacterized Fe-S cluster-containing protein